MDSSRPNISPAKKSRPTIHRTTVSTAQMPRRPTVYISNQGSTLGGVAGPPVGPTGPDDCSAMTALPFGRQNDRRAGACHTPDPIQRPDGRLQCRDIGHPHLEHVSLGAGHPPAVLDLGHRPHGLLDALVVDRVALD